MRFPSPQTKLRNRITQSFQDDCLMLQNALEFTSKSIRYKELLTGIEPVTSSLPRTKISYKNIVF